MRLGPERRRDRVGGVEPPAARPAAEPVAHHLDDVAEHGGLVVVELDELVVALEHRVVAVGGALEPARGGRRRAAVQRGLERREPPADVVEHAVQDQPQPALVGRGDQGVEVGLVAQPRVDPEVVDGVVPVALRREDRPEQQAVAAELDGVVQPRLQLPEPVPGRLAVRQRRPLRAGEAERIHLPQNGVITPGRHRPRYRLRWVTGRFTRREVKCRLPRTEPWLRATGPANGQAGLIRTCASRDGPSDWPAVGSGCA